MARWTLLPIAAVPLLLLGYCNLPITSCTATWLDVDENKLEKPVDVCWRKPDSRPVGSQSFARIGEHVYRVETWVDRQPGGPVCMTGVTCLPLYDRPRRDKRWKMVKLEGPVDLVRLHAYLDDRILSDGNATFDSLRRLPPLDPALDVAKLHLAFPGDVGAEYATDGRWVLYRGHVLPGADPSTLEAVTFALVASRAGIELPSLRGVVRDRHAVFFRLQPIKGADPATFVLVHYDRDHLYPGGDMPHTGWLGLDRKDAWYLPDDAAEPPRLSAQHYRDLRKELTRVRREQQLEPFDPLPN